MGWVGVQRSEYNADMTKIALGNLQSVWKWSFNSTCAMHVHVPAGVLVHVHVHVHALYILMCMYLHFVLLCSSSRAVLSSTTTATGTGRRSSPSRPLTLWRCTTSTTVTPPRSLWRQSVALRLITSSFQHRASTADWPT